MLYGILVLVAVLVVWALRMVAQCEFLAETNEILGRIEEDARRGSEEYARRDRANLVREEDLERMERKAWNGDGT